MSLYLVILDLGVVEGPQKTFKAYLLVADTIPSKTTTSTNKLKKLGGNHFEVLEPEILFVCWKGRLSFPLHSVHSPVKGLVHSQGLLLQSPYQNQVGPCHYYPVRHLKHPGRARAGGRPTPLGLGEVHDDTKLNKIKKRSNILCKLNAHHFTNTMTASTMATIGNGTTKLRSFLNTRLIAALTGSKECYE